MYVIGGGLLLDLLCGRKSFSNLTDKEQASVMRVYAKLLNDNEKKEHAKEKLILKLKLMRDIKKYLIGDE